MVDLVFMNHGSLVTMKAKTDAGTEWIDQHIPDNAIQWCGSIVIEPRYVMDIVEGAQADGLVCKA